MKKGIIVWLFMLLLDYGIAPTVSAQSASFGNYFRFEFVCTPKYSMVKDPQSFMASDTAVYQVLNFKNRINDNLNTNVEPKSAALLGVKLNPKLINFWSIDIKSVSKTYTVYNISDGSAATMIALGITKNNLKDYRYHVVENDSVEIVPWSKIPAMEQKYGAKQPYGFIGSFKSPGKRVLIEVVNINDYNDRDGVVFNWTVNFKPHISEIQVQPFIGSRFNLGFPKINHGYATSFSTLTHLALDTKFPVDSIQDLRFVFEKHTAIPYSIYLKKNISGKVDTALLVQDVIEDLYDLDGKNFEKPGKYELILYPAFVKYTEAQELHFSFEVLPPHPLDKKVTLKQTLPYIIATLTGVVLLFGGYYRRNQVKLLRAAQEKQTAGLKLQSIRAQLNPHFMFNALTSIQNLVNKNDIAGANHYLSKFAGLTRQVLDTGNEELLGLEQELTILDDYLQMEQLRFGFEFNITVDSSINSANAEIPAMLLQPFAENAVKHGVAILKDKGKIEVAITREEKDLLFCITDNGKWINKSNDDVTSGYGLKLSEERVALLNQLYKEQHLTLTITKQPVTVVCIRLSNWI